MQISPKFWTYFGIVGATGTSLFLFKCYFGGSSYYGQEKISGNTVIITGANTGIGFETAKRLAVHGGKIILACRDQEKCEVARKAIIEYSYNRNVHCRKLDLSSFASIHEFAELINKEEEHVEVLINNAGVMRCPKSYTADGLELQMGVNHFGHFLLTNLLLEKLKKSQPSRIINVSSLAHVRGKMNFDDINSEKKYEEGAVYAQSKLANILFTRELAKRLKDTGVTVNALHPGVVNTEIIRHMSFSKSWIFSFIFAPVAFICLKSPEQGAQTSIFAALSSNLETVTGKYFSDCKEKEVAEQAKNDEDALKLWTISESLTKLTS